MTSARLGAAAAAALLLAAVPASAVAQETPDETPMQTPEDVPDDTFLAAAHQGNLAEIAAGEDAQAHGTTECVEEAGEMLVDDHRRLDQDLRELAEKTGVDLPDEPTREQQKQLSSVQTRAGSVAYDEAWLSAQETAHRETLVLIDQKINSRGSPDVQEFAENARPVIAQHLEMVQGGECHADVSGGDADEAADAGGGGEGAQAAAPAPAPPVHAMAMLAAAAVVVTGAAWLAHRASAGPGE